MRFVDRLRGSWTATRESFQGHGWAGRVLLVIVLVGIVVRLLASVFWWPAVTVNNDSAQYAFFAAHNPLADVNHPAGYMFVLEGLGLLSLEMAFTIVVQHILGILSGLLIFSAVRRLVGSPWPGVIAAAAIMLNSDQIFLEHSIMSEGPFVFFLTAALYAGVRALDEPRPGRWWPILAGVLIAFATMIRTAGLFVIPVLALALLIGITPRPRKERWRGAVALLAVSGVLLIGYAAANDISNGRFEVGPTTGWHLYARVAGFANCRDFTPPAGTAGLCETTPASQRPGGDYYMHLPQSPAYRLFGYTGSSDIKVKGFALAVIAHQPRAYLRTVLHDIEYYYVPSLHGNIAWGPVDLSPALDWTDTFVPTPEYRRRLEHVMQSFYHRFTVHQDAGGLRLLHDFGQTFRFGGTLLSITTLLTLLGLLVGPRRNRLAVMLFGVGGLALLIAPTFGSYYVGRYSVPLAGLMMAAGGVACLSLWRMERTRRREATLSAISEY
jgi:4-amino-4-deoxy-L-arabinose transferase-like glycosyltransferase